MKKTNKKKTAKPVVIINGHRIVVKPEKTGKVTARSVAAAINADPRCCCTATAKRQTVVLLIKTMNGTKIGQH